MPKYKDAASPSLSVSSFSLLLHSGLDCTQHPTAQYKEKVSPTTLCLDNSNIHTAEEPTSAQALVPLIVSQSSNECVSNTGDTENPSQACTEVPDTPLDLLCRVADTVTRD